MKNNLIYAKIVKVLWLILLNVWDFNIHVQGEKLNSFVTFTQNLCILKCIICTTFTLLIQFFLVGNFGKYLLILYTYTFNIWHLHLHGYAWDFDVHVQGVKSNSFSTFTQKCLYRKPHGNMHNICIYPISLMLDSTHVNSFFQCWKIWEIFLDMSKISK
jgi:hypothetical protein